MAASLNLTVFDAAPGNKIQLTGSGLTGGGSAGVSLSGQGVTSAPGLSPTSINLPATFAGDGSSVTIGPIPDGVMSGTLTVTASDNSTATASLRAVSQYVQSAEYLGEGEDTSTLATMTAVGVSELDIIIRRASAAIDRYMGSTVRQLQKVEQHVFQKQKYRPPRWFPYQTKGRDVPIISLDQAVFISAADLITVFNLNDIYVNNSAGYIEILAYAIGNYALLGELQVIGYSANVVELAYTFGYPQAKYPHAVREACIMMTTAILNRRKRQSMGMGAFSKFSDKTVVDPQAVKIPPDAKDLLRPYVGMVLG